MHVPTACVSGSCGASDKGAPAQCLCPTHLPPGLYPHLPPRLQLTKRTSSLSCYGAAPDLVPAAAAPPTPPQPYLLLLGVAPTPPPPTDTYAMAAAGAAGKEHSCVMRVL